MSNNRSSHYDWFKQGNKQNNRSSKDSFKVVWKFTKIFLFFSLFFFSMWGCVQSLIVKTQTAIGQGVEIYKNSNNIAPSVSSLHIDKSTLNSQDIYEFNFKDDNIWINREEDDELLSAIHDELKNQGLNSLGDANKGGNIAFRIVGNGFENLENVDEVHKNIVIDDNDVPIVFSTASTEAPTFISSTPNLNALLSKGIHSYKIDENNYIVPQFGDGNVIDDQNLDLNSIINDLSDEEKNAFIFNTTVLESIIKQDSVFSFITAPAFNLQSKEDKQTWVIAHNNAYLFIKSVLGIDFEDNKWTYNGSIFGYKKNGYTPITSWSQAWDMHRGGGPFYGIFVFPISWVSNSIIDAIPILSGWGSLISIVLIVIIISVLMFALSFKGIYQQSKTQELQAKKAIIDAKYAAYKGNKQMEMRQKQEVADLYKREGINPLGSFGSIFITLPFFLTMWRIIGGTQHLKGTVWLGINFAKASWRELFAGHWHYLLLMVLAVLAQATSTYFPRFLANKRNKNRINIHQKEAMKKSNKTQNIMMVVFVGITLIWSAGLQIYFMVRSLWQIGQASLMHRIIVGGKKRKIKKARSY